jgi:hypothetical protein
MTVSPLIMIFIISTTTKALSIYFQTIYTLPLDKTSKRVYNIHIEYLQEFLGVYISLLFILIL